MTSRTRTVSWLPIVVALASIGCIEVENVPAREDDAGPIDAGSLGDGGPDLDQFEAGVCASACMDEHPSARDKFTIMSACISLAPDDTCAASCGSDPVGPTTPECTALGVLSEDPVCNACVKDLCCDFLAACLSDSECFATSLCSSRCDDAPEQ